MLYTIDLAGKTAIVTGGGSGIGRATAVLLAEAGANVAVLDTNLTAARETAGLVNEQRVVSTAHACDVASPTQALAAVHMSVSLGRPTILVNCAAVQPGGSLIEMDETNMRRALNVNFFGPLWMARAVWPHMKDQGGGSIVNVTSVQAQGIYSSPSVYQPAKAALESLTHCLMAEGAPHGIRVNAVAPGAIATQGIGNLGAASPKHIDDLRRAIPVGRRGWPEEAAFAILMLCAPGASYVNGATIVVDGGITVENRPASLLSLNPSIGKDPDAK